MHLNQEYNYSLSDLLAQIKTLKPDIVFGEIAPEAYNTVLEGYFPPEAAMLAQMATVLGYRFIPVDGPIFFYSKKPNKAILRR